MKALKSQTSDRALSGYKEDTDIKWDRKTNTLAQRGEGGVAKILPSTPV